MSKRRYSAAKRAREINKAEERARKLARKHGKTRAQTDSDNTAPASEPEAGAPPTPTLPPATVIDPDPTAGR
jgi:hypothetical protein